MSDTNVRQEPGGDPTHGQSSHGRPDHGGWDVDARDDWLGDEAELEWAEPGASAGSPATPRERPASGPAPEAAPPPRRELVLRRRAVALAALGVLAVVALVVGLALSSGGGGGATATEAGTTTTPTGTTTPATTRAAPVVPVPVLTVTLPAAGKLKLGDTGPEVRKLQRALNKLGHQAGTPDGSFGTTTQAAVVAFQTKEGLDADGVVGRETAAKLNAALQAQATPAT
jgi:hypothetical protein